MLCWTISGSRRTRTRDALSVHFVRLGGLAARVNYREMKLFAILIVLQLHVSCFVASFVQQLHSFAIEVLSDKLL